MYWIIEAEDDEILCGDLGLYASIIDIPEKVIVNKYTVNNCNYEKYTANIPPSYKWNLQLLYDINHNRYLLIIEQESGVKLLPEVFLPNEECAFSFFNSAWRLIQDVFTKAKANGVDIDGSYTNSKLNLRSNVEKLYWSNRWKKG